MKALEAKYTRDQAAWLQETGIQVGDMVKVIAAADDSCGWKASWVSGMYVGAIGVVSEIYKNAYGIRVNHDGTYYSYPFYVLVKI